MGKHLCKNRNDKNCGVDCAFYDCHEFEPTQYFVDGILFFKTTRKESEYIPNTQGEDPSGIAKLFIKEGKRIDE